MMRRAGSFVLGALSLLVLGGVSMPVAVADHQTNGGLYLNAVEIATSDTVIDVGDPGDSPGDLLTFHNKLRSGGRLVGSSHGSCIRIDPAAGTWECSWTNRLTSGQVGNIMVAGTFRDSGRATMAILGGTGAFRHATGVLRVRPIEEGRYQFEFDVWHTIAKD